MIACRRRLLMKPKTGLVVIVVATVATAFLLHWTNAFTTMSIPLQQRSKTKEKTPLPTTTISRKHGTTFGVSNNKNMNHHNEGSLKAMATEDTLYFVTEPVTVQRKYETYRWKYKSGFDDDINNDIEHFYNINYRVEGPMDGAPLLLVHGFGANVNHFRYQFEPLSEAGYRVYAIDLLGFGASDKPTSKPNIIKTNNEKQQPFGYCIELFVQIINDFINHINAQQQNSKPWVIAGNSIGGLCSLSMAAKRPDLIQSVVLFNCAGGMTGFRYSEISWYLIPVLEFVQNFVLGPIWGPRFFKNFKSRENVESILKNQGVYGDTTNVDEELLEILLGPSDDEGAEQVFLQVFGGPPGPTPESLLPNVKCPILALWGSADPWTPVDGGNHPGTKFGLYTSSNYTLEILPGAGHCPHDECPNEINAKMISWLKKVQSSFQPSSSPSVLQ